MIYGYGSIPINTIFSGMNIHLPAILGFTRYQGFDPSPYDNAMVAMHVPHVSALHLRRTTGILAGSPPPWCWKSPRNHLVVGQHTGHPTISCLTPYFSVIEF